MSGMGQKKKIKATAAMAVKPEETALRPKPSMHATKRPPGQMPSSSTLPVLAKKPRLDFSAGGGPSGKPGLSGVSPPRPQIDSTWLDFCKSTTVDVSNFADVLRTSFEEQKTNKSARLIAAVFRHFIEKKMENHKIFIEYHLLTTCAVAIKEHGEKLTNLYLHKCFLSLICWMKPLTLERQELLTSLSVCLANKQTNLDPYYINAFLHDSLGDRIWVDKPFASRLLSLIIKPFGTIFPTKEHYTSAMIEYYHPDAIADPNVPNKFAHIEYSQLIIPVMDCLKKCWAADPPNRNVLRMMSMFAGIPDVRSYASKRMDGWSQNIKLQRNALELLIFIGCNFGSAETDPDREVLSNLLKMRSLKSKQVAAVFAVVLREIINRNENNLRAALNLIIMNEFGPSQHRFPMNMTLLGMIFSYDNPKATKTFAQELSNTVIKREELAKHARLLTRELFRSTLRNEFNYPLFAESYLNFIIEEERRSELGIEDHVVYRSATEVITMLPLVSISPQVREAAIARRAGQTLANDLQYALNKMEKDLSAYYDVVLKWLQYAKNLFMVQDEYHTAYYRYLFLEKSDYYTRMDQGPTETEFLHAAKIFGEFCFTDRHMKLILGEQFNSLRQEDTVQLLYDLLKRSTAHRNSESRSVVSFISGQSPASLAQRLLDVCIYRPNFHYDGELLPMFVSDMYWKSWIIIMLWGCCGKSSDVLNSMIEAFPMFRYFIHIMLTKQYEFPIAFEGLNEEEMIVQERHIVDKEVEDLIKQENLFERKHNRDTDVTEYSSQLVKTCLVAQNCIRRVPEHVLEELKAMANECHLVASLSESKNPDLLKMLIENYGAPKAMPAIQDLLATNVGAIDSLDILILCEFLVFHLSTEPRHRQIGEEKMNLITAKLRSSMELDATPLLFFLKKLSSPNLAERTITHRSLIYLLEESVDGFFQFSRIERLGSYNASKAEIGSTVASSLLYETDSNRTEAAIEFVTKTLCKENMHQIAAAVCPLADRPDSSLLKTLIVFYDRYHSMCQEFPKEWALEGIEKHIVTLPKGEIFMASGIIKSTLKLLCKSSSNLEPSRENLINIWFPEGKDCPQVTCNGSSIDIFPEDLRSKMLCAEDERITKVALQGVTGQAASKLLSSFGLTNYSATQLMSVIDKMTIDEIGKEQAVAMRLFVVAYRYRGAIGGEAFLEALKKKEEQEEDDKKRKIREHEEEQKMITQLKKQDKERKKEIKKEEVEVKEEPLDESMEQPVNAKDEGETDEDMESEDASFESSISELPPIPKAVPARIDIPEYTMRTSLKKEEAQTILNEITNVEFPEIFICPQILMKHAPFSEDIATLCVQHFQTHLKFFLANTNAFHQIMMILSDASYMFSQIRNKMVEITKTITKDGPISTLYQGYLKKFMDPVASKTKMQKPGNERSRAMMAIEEMIRGQVKREENIFKEKLVQIFGGSIVGEVFVAQAPQKYSPETVLCILWELLSSFNEKYNPALVSEYVKQCCYPEVSCLKDKAKLTVLAQYLGEMVIREPKHTRKAVDLLERMVSTNGFELLIPIGKSLQITANSNIKTEISSKVANLLKELTKTFPCLHIDKVSGEITLQGPRWQADQGERYCSRLIFSVIECEEQEEVFKVLDSLQQLVHTHPSLVIRDFGILVNQLSAILEKDTREFKTELRKETIKTIRETAVTLIPTLQKSDLYHVDTAITMLLSIYNRFVKGKEDATETGLADAIVALCFTYLENHLESGKTMLMECGDAVRDCCYIHPENPASIGLLEHMKVIAV